MLSWQPSQATDIKEYNIYRSENSFNDVSLIAPIQKTTSVSYKDTGLESEKKYYYAVAAVDKYGNELKTVIAKNGTVADTIAPAPVSDVSTNPLQNEPSVIISWSTNDSTDFS